MRRWPRLIVPVVAVAYFLGLAPSTRRSFELSVQRVAQRARSWVGAPSFEPGARPALDASVAAAIGRRIDPRFGRARVARIDARGDRLRLIVERGRDDGVAPGDVAVVDDGDASDLIGEVVACGPHFAAVRTLLDADAWWLARAGDSRFIVGADVARGVLRARRPERLTRLRDGDPVVTAEDLHAARIVPAGLRIGTLAVRAGDVDRAHVVPRRDPRSVLAVSFLRGGVPIELGPARPAARARWVPISVAVGRDAGRTRASVVARGADAAIVAGLPVARGTDLVGWVRVVGDGDVHVRLLADPGFLAHVLLLRGEGDAARVVGSAVFRGARGRDAVEGVLSSAVGEARVGDRLVLGPHEGAGGVGLSLGRVVHSEPAGRITLDRRPHFERGDVVWVGVFPRPPESLGEGDSAP